MSETLSLWEFLRELVTNAGLRDWFAHDPQGALQAHGLDHLSPDDVHDALVLAEDNQTADFSRDYTTGHNAVGWSSPPPPVPGESEHEAAVRYLNTYVTNYADDRDAGVDNSVNQQVDTHGGDFDQDIDAHSVVASGDGAVAAGGDIDGSTITTGSHNQVEEPLAGSSIDTADGDVAGDGDVVGDRNRADEPLAGSRINAVTGDHDTTAFGSGNAAGTGIGGDLNIGDGGAFASGGSAGVDNSDRSLHDVGNTSADTSVHDSFKDQRDHSVHDSFTTHEDASTHGSFDDNSELSARHAWDDESDDSTHVDNSQDHVGNIDGH
jgi:hypothetical protein